VDVRRALTYLFQDPRWVRMLGTAALLGLLPAAVNLPRTTVLADRFPTDDPVRSTLVGWVAGLAMVPVSGYGLRLVRGAAAGADLPLPGWNDAGGLVRDGAKLWVVITIWGLPWTVREFLPRDSGGGALGALFLLLGLAQLALLVVQPAAEARLATTGSLAAGLDIGAAFGAVGRNPRGYLVLVVVTAALTVAGIGLSVGLVWLAWSAAGGTPGLLEVLGVGVALGPATVLPYGVFVLAHLTGQAYRGWQRASRRPAGRRGAASAVRTPRRPTRRRR
jgi:hypothetical protein